jgi:enoyl-CoA hydratase/carnithine racemase
MPPMIRVQKDGALVTLRLDKARGNAIDEGLARELVRLAAELSQDDSVRGVLLASAHPKLFSPGLDLVTLLTFDRGALERFMRIFSEAVYGLYGLRKPLVAAIGGHAVAGGCILALTADYRILRKGGVQIGLNELKIGVPLPWPVALLLKSSVPPDALAEVALLGTSVSDEKAVHLGLVHALAESEGFDETCLSKLREFADRDTAAFAATKAYLRRDLLHEMKAHEAEFEQEWLDCWFSEPTQDRIRKIVASLQPRS